jgi:hypothetical protein
MLQDKRQWSQDSILGAGKRSVYSLQRSYRRWVQLSLSCIVYLGLFPQEIEWPDSEANNLIASSADVKNAVSYASIPPYHLMVWCFTK